MKKVSNIVFYIAGVFSILLLAIIIVCYTFGWAFADTAAYTSTPAASGYSTNVGYGDDADDYCVVQPFTATASGNLTAISSWFAKNTAPGWIPKVEIFSDSSGSPGSLIEIGSALSPSTFVVASVAGYNSASFTQATSTFSGTTAIVSGARYWIVYSSDGNAGPGLDDDNLIGADTSGASTGGRGHYPCGSNWSELGTQPQIAAVVMVSSGGGGGGSAATPPVINFDFFAVSLFAIMGAFAFVLVLRLFRFFIARIWS